MHALRSAVFTVRLTLALALSTAALVCTLGLSACGSSGLSADVGPGDGGAPADRSGPADRAGDALPPDGSGGGRDAADGPGSDGLTGDGGGDGGLPAAGCNPLAPEGDCLLPYPSDVFLVPDGTLPGGTRVAIPPMAQPVAGGQPFDVIASFPVDGFSHATQILALFPGGVDPSNLVFHTGDVGRSLTSDSPTQLLDAETGERVLHFAELDPRPTADLRRVLVIRPLVRLGNGRRYVVALAGLQAPGGGRVTASAGFVRLRDGTAAGEPRLSDLAARYETDVFAVTTAAGLDRAALDLAWDFTTETEAQATRDMLAARADAIAQLQAAPPEVAVTGVEVDPKPHVARLIHATLTVPLYLDSDQPEAHLFRDGSGNVVQNGTAQVPFSVIIPPSVASAAPGSPPARLLQFGHGFFGSQAEATGFPAEFADAHGFVIVAADWWGMSQVDAAGLIANNATPEMLRFTDRVHQAMVNFIALGAAAQGPLAARPELDLGQGLVYDPGHLYFYGISQGAILGGTYVALAPGVERAAFSVGGSNFSLMMFRSNAFRAILALLGTQIHDPADQQKVALLTQTIFDRIDPATYAPHLLHDPLPGVPAVRPIVYQIGLGDVSVPNLGAHFLARSAGLPQVVPGPAAIAGLDTITLPADGSGLVQFDFHLDPLPGVEAIPPTGDNPVHEGVRRSVAGQKQLDRFLRPDGQLVDFCDGVCDPE